VTKNHAAQAREAARQGDGKFGAQVRAEDTAVNLDRSPTDWHIGPSSWNESFQASRIMRDWEDRLQCAEAVNEAVDSLTWEHKDSVAYLALTETRTDDYEDCYSAQILDAKGQELGFFAVPGFTFNDGVPADFQVASTSPMGERVREFTENHDLTLDVAKVRAYAWDEEQDKMLVRMNEVATRALAAHAH
jgi:hypothetical protein